MYVYILAIGFHCEGHCDFKSNSAHSLIHGVSLHICSHCYTHQFKPSITDSVLVETDDASIFIDVVECIHTLVLLSIQPCDLHV